MAPKRALALEDGEVASTPLAMKKATPKAKSAKSKPAKESKPKKKAAPKSKSQSKSKALRFELELHTSEPDHSSVGVLV